jgi:predicted permease
MDITQRVAESMLLILLLYSAAIAMRWWGILREDHAGVLAKIITHLVLPAVVFVHLADNRIRWNMLEAPALMFSAVVVFSALGWAVGRWPFRLSRPQLGAVILCAGFTSAAFLGIPLVQLVYAQTMDLEETVLISELGNGMPLFLLGPLIAAYFGEGDARFSLGRQILDYIRSPLFIAIVAGVGWGALALPTQGSFAVDVLFTTLQHIEGSLIALVGLTIGLMLRPLGIRQIAALLAFVAVCQLLLQPLYLAGASRLIGLPQVQVESLILQGAAPVAALPAVFCREYGCDGRLAAGLILGTTLLALVTIPLIVVWLA